ncbi:MAG: YceI family protein [Vicinamibacterales bacterium]
MVTTWQIDPSHTDAGFAVKHLMIATVRGRFSDVNGSVVVTGDDFGTATLDVTIGTASLDTREPKRDAHLRSADFFDADRFPVMTFTSRRVIPDGRGYAVTGDLTIRGVTRQVVFNVIDEGRVRDPWGGERAGFSATAIINRQDFGLTWNAVLEAGGVLVGDDVKISVDLELVKQASASVAA